MRNKTWLFALMLSASALTAAACNDSSGYSDDVEDSLQYFLSCSSPANCTLVMETNQQGNVAVMLSSLDSEFKANFVSGANVQALRSGNGFSIMDGSSDTATIISNDSGIATLSISSGAESGSGTIVFSTPDLETTPITFNINVIAPELPPEPVEKAIDYSAIIAYYGPQEGFNYVEAYAVPNGNCSTLISSGMTSKDVAALTPSQLIGSQNVTDGNIAGKKITFQTTETETVNYAVVSRAKINDEYVAYGCTNGLNAENFMVTVVLDDVFIEEPVDPCEEDPSLPECQPPVVDPCEEDPSLPECQEVPPVDTEYSYTGNFTLMSQFNALSLLPSASENGETPRFKDMLAGDWIQFVLDFLSHPEEALPDVLTQQLLPLITDGDWLKNLLSNIPDIGPVIAVMLDTMDIDQLLTQFGIKQIITDYLKQLTSQLEWWDEATGGVQIANELATNFTLYGKFRISSADLDENGKLSGNTHSYSSVLYHNGTFSDCLIGTEFSTDINGSKICEIPIATLDKDAASVKGTFTAHFNEIVADKGTVDILSHNLNLAYGKLIYAALIQIMPYVMKTEDGVKIDSLGDILAYYIGLGALSLYNKNNETQITDVAGCDAVGAVLVQLITDKLAGQDASAWAKLLSFILQPGTVSGLCSMGIGALDSMLDKQLDKLSVSSDKITFSTPQDKSCQIAFAGENPYKKLAYFGMSDYKWGMNSKVDERCTWNVEIKARDGVDPKTITGRFNAYSNK